MAIFSKEALKAQLFPEETAATSPNPSEHQGQSESSAFVNSITEGKQSQVPAVDADVTDESVGRVGGDNSTPAEETRTDATALVKRVWPTMLNVNLPVPMQSLVGFVQDIGSGKFYAAFQVRGAYHTVLIESSQMTDRIRRYALQKDMILKPREIQEVKETLLALASVHAVHDHVLPRVAPVQGGIEIDLMDERFQTVQITASATLVRNTATSFFARPTEARALPVPVLDKTADIGLLRSYINVKGVAFHLLVAYITFTIASPKIDRSKYVFLVLRGAQGTGKTFASKVIKNLIDPSSIDAQTLPNAARDLGIMLQACHLALVDNVRDLSPQMSDLLCMASTGGVTVQRKLFTDEGLKALKLHGAILFNGIHPFMGQSDFSDRTVCIELAPIGSEVRRSDSELLRALEADHPRILGALYKLIQQVFQVFPDVCADAPTRMVEFCRWLAAMEQVMQLEARSLQDAYKATLVDSQLESLMDNPLAAVLLQFSEKQEFWDGTPTELYQELSNIASFAHQRSRAWPSSAASMSKRLHGLQGPLLSQGVEILIARGKERQIVVHSKNFVPEAKAKDRFKDLDF
jgi:hypothetical protein